MQNSQSDFSSKDNEYMQKHFTIYQCKVSNAFYSANSK